MKMMSSALPEAPCLDAPSLRKNAAVTIAVIETAAPATNAAELPRQSSLVARKIALRIWGPAIITNDSGMIFARVMVERLLRPSSYFSLQVPLRVFLLLW
jgi:hypothetical protein